MKKSIIFLGMLGFTMVYAQQQNTNGKVGVNTEAPTETLDVKGTAKIQDLPKSGEGKIYNGTADKNTTFTGTRTVVADANGVLGYMDMGSNNTSGTKWLGNNAVCTATEVGDAIVVAGGKYVCVDVDFKGTKYPSWVYEGVIYKHMAEPIVGTVYTMLPLITMQKEQGGVEFTSVQIKASTRGDQADGALVVNRRGSRSPFFSIRTRAMKDYDFAMQPNSMMVGSETEIKYSQLRLGKDDTTFYYLSTDYIQEAWVEENPTRGQKIYNDFLSLINSSSTNALNSYNNPSWLGVCISTNNNSNYTGRYLQNLSGVFFSGSSNNAHCWDLNYRYPTAHDAYYGYANAYSAFLSMDYLPTTVIREIPKK